MSEKKKFFKTGKVVVRKSRERKYARSFIPKTILRNAKEKFGCSESTIRSRFRAGHPEYLEFFKEQIQEYKLELEKSNINKTENVNEAIAMLEEMKELILIID